MRKASLVVLGLGLVAAFAPLTAQADHCSSNVVIFSGITGAPKVNSGAGACAADPAHDTPYDGRIINPGSNGISVRYILGCTLGDTIESTLSGDVIGADQGLTLTCTNTTTGIAYNSAEVAIDPTAVGCLTATVEDPDAEGTNVTTFHTVGSLC